MRWIFLMTITLCCCSAMKGGDEGSVDTDSTTNAHISEEAVATAELRATVERQAGHIAELTAENARLAAEIAGLQESFAEYVIPRFDIEDITTGAHFPVHNIIGETEDGVTTWPLKNLHAKLLLEHAQAANMDIQFFPPPASYLQPGALANLLDDMPGADAMNNVAATGAAGLLARYLVDASHPLDTSTERVESYDKLYVRMTPLITTFDNDVQDKGASIVLSNGNRTATGEWEAILVGEWQSREAVTGARVRLDGGSCSDMNVMVVTEGYDWTNKTIKTSHALISYSAGSGLVTEYAHSTAPHGSSLGPRLGSKYSKGWNGVVTVTLNGGRVRYEGGGQALEVELPVAWGDARVALGVVVGGSGSKVTLLPGEA